MSEKCETCNGKGALVFQPRTYEYPTFSTPCRDCEGTGMHRHAFNPGNRLGLDMRSERIRKEYERCSQRRIDDDFVYGVSSHLKYKPFQDEFHIGQRRVAEIRMETAGEMVIDACVDAFSTEYVPEEWREMKRRLVEAGMAEYRRAQYILAALDAGVELEEAA